MEVQECTARKWRRKSRPIKLGRTTSEEEQMEEELPADTEQESFTTEDKENAQRSDNDGQCQLCNRVFGSKVQLQTHMRLHANGRGLTCDHCGKQYANKSKLKRHSRSHTGEKPYSCSFCSKNFSRSDNLTTHVLRQHQAARVCACAKCYATYITISELKEHRDNCHPGEAVFQCALCDEVKVESGELLTEHLKAVHDDIILKITTEEPMAVEEPLNGTPDKTVTVKSPDTDTSGGSGVTKTDNSSNSGSKRKTTTPKKLKLSRYDDSADSVSDYEEVDSPRNSSIERNGDRDLSLMKHKIYTRKNEQNGYGHYEPPNGLKRPRLSNHHQALSAPAFVCTKCDVVFQSEDLHNEHNELFHDRSDSPSSYSSKGSIEDEWPNAVSCEICHLLLKNIHYLQRHLQRKHHDGIDYLCPRCPERQATLTGLIDHVRVQHSSGEESHCEECNALFPNKVDLQMHFRQHRVHQCNLCSKQFTMIHKLQRHLRRHFSSKACTICGQKFANDRDLAPHVERVHGLPMEAYSHKASERSSDENTTMSSVLGSTRYAASRPSMCMTCGKTLPWGMRKLRVSSGEQWANMCKECVDRYQKPKDWLSAVKSERGHQANTNGGVQRSPAEEEDVADDESSESCISGDESISGKSIHHCGICSVSCVSIPKLILHMDSDHHGVDKRHLWDLLVETLLARKRPANHGVSSDDAAGLYLPSRDGQAKHQSAKVLTPLNENKLRDDEGRLTLTYNNPTRALALNPSSLVGLASWFTVNAEHGQDVANWVGNGKPGKSNGGPMQEIIAMDLTSKKSNEEKSVDDEGRDKRDEGIVEAKYRCESCPAAFETQENLDAHTRNHEMNAQARCYICNQDMASQTELLKHLMLHRHTSYHCKVCGKSLSSWSKFEAHMGTHDNGAKFACCFCDIQFFDKARLVQHLSDVHDRNDSQICGACGKIYFDHNLLDDHIKEHEDDDLTPPPAVLPIVDSKDGPTQRGRPKLRRMIEDRRKQTDPERSADLFYASPLCPTSFPSSVNLNAQDSRAQTFASSLINRSISDNVGTSHGTKTLSAKTSREESPLDKQSHVCVYCDKEFSALAKLQRHIRKHTGEKPFRCLYCEMRFSRSDNLHTHMVRRHTEEAERKCQECGDKYHNHSWSQWYQHLKYPGGVPKDMETKKRSRSPAQTLCQPQISLLAAHQATMPSLIPSGGVGEKDERRPRFRAKQRRERELQLGDVPSLDELGRLLPGVDGAQIHYPFISQSTLFRMGLTVDPSALLIQHPSSVVTQSSVGAPRPLSDLPQMVMVQPEALVTKTQLPNTASLDSDLLNASINAQKPVDSNGIESMESIKRKSESPELEKVTADHGVHIRQDVAMLAANALVDLDQEMKDDEKPAEETEEALADKEEANNTEDQSMEEVTNKAGPIDEAFNDLDQDLEDDPKDSSDLCIDEQAGEEDDDREERRDQQNVPLPESVNELDEELDGGARESRADGESCESCDDIAIECEFCPLVFDGINNLTDHMITHKNVDPGELNTAIQKVMLCHSASPTGANLGEPPALIPPPAESRPVAPPVTRPHACDQCDKSFTTKPQLSKHAKEHQNREFPFSCTLCEKKFKTTSRLQRHLKTHSGDAPHACTFCGKKFARKDNLKVHIINAHNGADATQCPKCSKRFETPYALRQHMRWHTDRKYECSVCGTSFTWKCYLVRHMKSRHPEMAEV